MATMIRTPIIHFKRVDDGEGSEGMRVGDRVNVVFAVAVDVEDTETSVLVALAGIVSISV